MCRFSKKTGYALLALQCVASAGEPGGGRPSDAERFETPLELLAKILQRLAPHGLIPAHRGDIDSPEIRFIPVTLQKQQAEGVLAGRTR
jgi:DNA-binding IscR family transcriptional regulator